ncbi:MAG: hypothetical protein QW597_06690 [Thermoplasmataceae archaeon]
MPQQNKPLIRYKEDEYKEVSAKDLSRKELLSYIFGDSIRGFYILGCIFLDGLLVGEAFDDIPGFYSINLTTGYYFSNFSIFAVYVLLVSLFTDLILIFYEIKFYRKRWPKKGL